MNIKAVRLKSFRSFQGTEDITFVMKRGLNFVVGENSVGKSSFLRALGILAGQLQYNNLDYFKGELDQDLLIEAELELSIEELQETLRRIAGLNQLVTPDFTRKFCDEFGNNYTLTFSPKNRPSNNPLEFFSLRNKRVQFSQNQMILTKGENQNPTTLGDINEFLQRYNSTSEEVGIAQFIQSQYAGNASDFRFALSLKDNPLTSVRNLFHSKLKIFSEIRKRPAGSNQKVWESLDGGQLADVLLTLKNGNKKERKKFDLIKDNFVKLFPNLRLEVMGGGQNTAPSIVIDKVSIDYEVPIENVGAGIGEMVILLTHLIQSKDLIFGLDMPEIQFHPHAQRILLSFLEDNSKSNQLIVITHSPTLLSAENIGNISIIREETEGTRVKELPESYFDMEERPRIERVLQITGKEFFFSRAALLMEGPTETGAFPLFAKSLQKNFDAFGVSIICIGKHFGLFAKLLIGFDIPYRVVNDRDALTYIEDTIKVNGTDVRTSAVFSNLFKIGLLSQEELELIRTYESQIISQAINNKKLDVYSPDIFEKLLGIANNHGVDVLSSDFEGILKQAGFENILNQAALISESKVVQGRFVAEQIIQQNLKIPQEFVNVIDIVCNPSHMSDVRRKT